MICERRNGDSVLVTCEGIDGSGKSTVARGLAAALQASLHAEPTQTWLGQAVRRGFQEEVNAWSEALLFMADHATHVEQVKKELAEGKLVISDRWSDSTFAYQGAALGDMAVLQGMEKPFDLTPDLTLLFDLDVAEALRRVNARGATEKFERQEFLEKVRANYLALAKAEPSRFVVVDAARPPEVVLADAIETVRRRTTPKQRS